MTDFGANIVMQGIGYDQANQRALFDRLMSIAQYGENKRQFNDTMAFNRTKPKDLSLQEQILQDVMAYKQGSATPEQMLRLQSYADMEGDKTQYQADAYGNVRAVTSPNPIGVMLGGGGAADKLFDTAGQEEMPAQPTPMRNSTGAGDMLFETSALPEVDPRAAPDRPLNPEEFERMSLTGELPDALPTLPPASGNYSGSPVEDIERGKERAKVEAAGSMLPVKAAEADIAASGKMAENYGGELGTEAAKEEARMKGLGELKRSLDAMIPLAEKAPSGVFENAGAWVSNKAGFPSEGANAAAAFDASKAITGLQSRINFLKGQGTITDSEAKQAMSFLPDPNDSASVKVTKLKTASAEIQAMIDGKSAPLSERQQGNPGFRYIGVKK